MAGCVGCRALRPCASTGLPGCATTSSPGWCSTTMLVPVGIAYAVASGVPGIYGLYATIVPLLAYAVFGPSRILVLGPDSSLAPVILAVVLPLSAGDPQRAIALASAMAIVVGPGLHPGRRRAARLRHRAPLEADPLRLHERHRAHGADQPAAEAASASPSRRRDRCGSFGRSATAMLGPDKTNWTALVVGVGTLAAILLLQGQHAAARPC